MTRLGTVSSLFLSAGPLSSTPACPSSVLPTTHSSPSAVTKSAWLHAGARATCAWKYRGSASTRSHKGTRARVRQTHLRDATQRLVGRPAGSGRDAEDLVAEGGGRQGG